MNPVYSGTTLDSTPRNKAYALHRPSKTRLQPSPSMNPKAPKPRRTHLNPPMDNKGFLEHGPGLQGQKRNNKSWSRVLGGVLSVCVVRWLFAFRTWPDLTLIWFVMVVANGNTSGWQWQNPIVKTMGHSVRTSGSHGSHGLTGL